VDETQVCPRSMAMVEQYPSRTWRAASSLPPPRSTILCSVLRGCLSQTEQATRLAVAQRKHHASAKRAENRRCMVTSSQGNVHRYVGHMAHAHICVLPVPEASTRPKRKRCNHSARTLPRGQIQGAHEDPPMAPRKASCRLIPARAYRLLVAAAIEAVTTASPACSIRHTCACA